MDNASKYQDYLFERTQKITEALYRVTDFFRDTEPLKWTLRKESVCVLESILNIGNFPHFELSKELDSLNGRIKRLIRLLELASASSFVSEANFSVLKREYFAIKDFLTDKKN